MLNQRLNYVIIILVSLLFFLPGIGMVHLFDWDEINFAESAREMLVTQNFTQVTVNYIPFWEKPPLFIWMQAISMKIFGVNEFAARFPNVIAGIITLCVIFYIGKKVFTGHVAHWWVLCYLGALIPSFYFKTGLIDPFFNLFIFLSIYQFYIAFVQYSMHNTNRHFFYAGIFTGIAILTKGPVALLIAMLTIFVFWIIKRFKNFISIKQIILYGITILLVSSLWFVPEMIKNGPYFLIEFIKYQIGLFSQNIAGHQQPFYYHTVVLLVGCFPISLVVLFLFKTNERYSYYENTFLLIMRILFFVVLILFSIVKTKIVHYSSLCWLPLTFLSAYAIESLNNNYFRWKSIYTIVLSLLGLIIAALILLTPFVFIDSPLHKWILQNISDVFTHANITLPGAWKGFEGVGALFILLGLFLFAIFIAKHKPVLAFGGLLISMSIANLSISYLLIPKIEPHTQGAAIQFLKTLKNKDVYIFNAGYKSYAPLFYASIKPLHPSDGMQQLIDNYMRQHGVESYLQLTTAQRDELDDKQKYWLMYGNVDKPVYFIAKINDLEDLPECTNLISIMEKGGFKAYFRFK